MRHVFPRLVLFRDFRVVVRVDAARDDAGPDGRGVRDARWTHKVILLLLLLLRGVGVLWKLLLTNKWRPKLMESSNERAKKSKEERTLALSLSLLIP